MIPAITVGKAEQAAYYRVITPAYAGTPLSGVWSDFSADWRAEWFGKSIEPPTWYMADDVVSEGLDGILFPSQARPGGTNLVVYRSSVRSAAQLRVYAPSGALRKIAPPANE